MEGAHRYTTMYAASLDVKTEFDCGQAGVCCLDVEGDESAWLDYCGAAGGDVGPKGKGKLRILRDGIQTLRMCQAEKRGSADSRD